MTGNSTAPQTWGQCSPGQLQCMVNRLRAERQRRRFYRLVGVTSGMAGLLLLVGLICQQVAGPSAADSADLTCQQVKPLLAGYAAGRMANSQMGRGIQRHLDACPPCAAIFRQLLATQPTAAHFQHRPSTSRVARIPMAGS